jgi:hypothetical protein
MCKRSCHLIDGTIAADGYCHVCLSLHAALGYLGSVAGIARQLDFIVIQLVIQPLLNQVGYLILRVCSRNGIDDENDLLFTHNYMQNYENRLIIQLNMQEKWKNSTFIKKNLHELIKIV